MNSNRPPNNNNNGNNQPARDSERTAPAENRRSGPHNGPRPGGQRPHRPQHNRSHQPRHPNENGAPTNGQNGPNSSRQQPENNGHRRPNGPGGNSNNPHNRPHHGGPRRPDNRGGPHRHNSPRANQPFHQNNRPVSSTPQRGGGIEGVYAQYDALLDEHLAARKRYFEYFNRVDDRQRKKMEDQFFHSIEKLRNFENSLRPWQKEFLVKKVDRYSLDLTYSSNHELPIEGKSEVEGPFSDPHFLKSQELRPSYKDDKEETLGTIEDYKKLKGLL